MILRVADIARRSRAQRWQAGGHLLQRTSTFKMGAAQFFDRETFGADATRLAADNWEIAARTTAMLRAAFEFAGKLASARALASVPVPEPGGNCTRAATGSAFISGGVHWYQVQRATCWERRLWEICWNAI